MKLMVADAQKGQAPQPKVSGFKGSLADNTIRLARLKLMLIAGKMTSHAKKTVVKYSAKDGRTPVLLRLLQFLDSKRNEVSCKKNLAQAPSGNEPDLPIYGIS